MVLPNEVGKDYGNDSYYDEEGEVTEQDVEEQDPSNEDEKIS